MKKTTYLVLAAACLTLAWGCGGSSGLAADIVGTYIGVLITPAGIVNNHTVVITEIDGNTVQVASASAGVSSTFIATLAEGSIASSVEAIGLFVDDILANNGSMVPSIGRLSYAYHLGGDADTNTESFVGTKQ